MDIYRAGRLPSTIGALLMVDLDRVSTLGAETLVLVAALLHGQCLARPTAVDPRPDGGMARPVAAAASGRRGGARPPAAAPGQGGAGPRSIIWCGCQIACWCWRPSACADACRGEWTSGPGRSDLAVSVRLRILWQNALHLEAVRACAGPGVRSRHGGAARSRLVRGRAARGLLPAGGPAPGGWSSRVCRRVQASGGGFAWTEPGAPSMPPLRTAGATGAAISPTSRRRTAARSGHQPRRPCRRLRPRRRHPVGSLPRARVVG